MGQQSKGVDHSHIECELIKRVAPLRRFVADTIPARFQSVIDADDILQNVLLDVFCRLPGSLPAGGDGLDRWLRTLAHSRLADAIKALGRAKRGGNRTFVPTRRRSSYTELFDRLASPQKTPRSELAEREAEDLLRAAIDDLPESQRKAITMRFIGRLPHAEIAEGLGKSQSAVNSLICRAFGKLRARLGRASKYLSSG